MPRVNLCLVDSFTVKDQQVGSSEDSEVLRVQGSEWGPHQVQHIRQATSGRDVHDLRGPNAASSSLSFHNRNQVRTLRSQENF